MPTTEQYPSHAISRGTFRRPGQSKEAFKVVLDGDTTSTALVEPVSVVQSALPLTTASGTTGYLPTSNWTCARIVFGGTASANLSGNYQVVLWYPVEPISGADEMSYMPVVAARGTFVTGANVYTTDDYGAAANLFADIITDEYNISGVTVNSPLNDNIAWMDVDLHNASGIEIETDLGSLASIDVLLQFGETPAAALGSVSIQGVSGTTRATNDVVLVKSAGTSQTALANPAPIAALPDVGAATTSTTGAIRTGGARAATIIFGSVTAMAAKDFQFQVVGWKRAESATAAMLFMPSLICKGIGVIGTATYAVTGMGTATDLYADTIVLDSTTAGRTKIHSPQDNTMAYLVVDVDDYMAIEIEYDRAGGVNTSTSVDIMMQFSDDPLVDPEPQKDKVRLVMDGDTSAAAITTPLPAIIELPLAGAGTSGGVRTNGKEFCQIMFGGTDTANDNFTYTVTLYRRIQGIDGADFDNYWPELVCSGTATLGADTYVNNDIGATGNFIADTITDSVERQDLVSIWSPADDSMAVISIDVRNYEAVQVRTDIDAGGTASVSVDCLMYFGRAPSPFELRNLVGGRNDATTDSIHGKIGTDTEMGDASLYDMLGGNDAATTVSINGKLGTNTEMLNNSLYDMVLPLLGAKKSVLSVVTANLFTISGGMVQLNNIIGYLTTAIQDQANNTKLVMTPTGGTATDICGVLNVANAGEFGLLSITGTFVDAMVLTPTVGLKAGIQAGPIMLTPGVISLNCVADNSGTIDWYVDYTPMVVGAKIAAVT